METLELLAVAMEYPEEGTLESVREAARRVEGEAPELAAALGALADLLESAPAGEAEERYTVLFDLSPVCTLHVGYHLFGETYQRGAFLAGMAGELRIAGLEPKGGELADHVSSVLRLLARANDEDRATLVDLALLPALTRMSVALGDAPQVEDPAGAAPSRRAGNVWAGVLRALPSFLAPLGSGEPAELFLPAMNQSSEATLDA